MKRKWAIILISVIVVLGIIIGCKRKQSTKEEVYSDFQEKISTMSSYSCTAEIKTVGNKKEHNYQLIHTYNKPDNYKLEVISPKHLKGKIIEYKGDKILVTNPNIDDVLELPNVGKNDQYMFIGDFIKNYLQNEEVSISLSNDRLILETYIPGDNQYFNKQVLYVNSDTKTPEMMEILDNKKDVKFLVTYKKFQWKK